MNTGLIAKIFTLFLCANAKLLTPIALFILHFRRRRHRCPNPLRCSRAVPATAHPPRRLCFCHVPVTFPESLHSLLWSKPTTALNALA